MVGLAKCDANQPCPQHDAFLPVRKQIIAYLQHTTLDQMSDPARKMSSLPTSRAKAPASRSSRTDLIGSDALLGVGVRPFSIDALTPSR